MSLSMRDSRTAVAWLLPVLAALLVTPPAVGQDPQTGGADADSVNYGPGSYGRQPGGVAGGTRPTLGTSPSPPSGARTPPGNNTGNTRNTTRQPANRSTDPYSRRRDEPRSGQQRMRRPVFISGKVVTDSGEPPPERVLVKMDCNGNARAQGYTDSKGRFSFQPNSDVSLLMTDASVGTGWNPRTTTNSGLTTGASGRVNLLACSLLVHLPGYRSDRLPLGVVGSLERNDVGVIVLHRLEGVEGHTVSLTSLTAPREARKRYEKGTRMLRRTTPNYEKSAAHFEQALEVYPEFAEAWYALGEARLGLNDQQGAREAFSRSIDADPKLLKPYEPLIQMAYQHGEWAILNTLSERYLKLSPGSDQVRFLAAVSAANLGDMELAESLVSRLRDEGDAKNWPMTHIVMAMVYEDRRQFEKAATEYETFLKVSSDPAVVPRVKRLLFEWESLRVIQPRRDVLAETQ